MGDKALEKPSNGACQPVLSYADVARNRSSAPASIAEETLAVLGTNVPAPKGDDSCLPTPKDPNDVAAVRLPSRDFVSSGAMPAIQFGSHSQKPSAPSPVAEQCAELGAAAATSSSVPATIANSACKPRFGSGRSSTAADSSERPAQHGRKQKGQKHRPTADSSSRGGKPKGPASKHRSSHGKPKPASPQELDLQTEMSAQHPYYASDFYQYQGYPQVRFPSKRVSAAPYTSHAGLHCAPHYMFSQPTGYGMYPTAGWVTPLPQQLAYAPTSVPGYEQHLHASPGAGNLLPPHGMYDMPNYSVPSHMSAPSSCQGLANVAPVTASPTSDQNNPGAQSHLRASAQPFTPVRCPIRIVNPETNEEVVLSKVASVPAVAEEKVVWPKIDATASVATTIEPTKPEETDLANATLVEAIENDNVVADVVVEEAVAEPTISAEVTGQDVNAETAANKAKDEQAVDSLSEPSSESRRILTPAEVAELYAGKPDTPTLMDEILRYPRVFLERFTDLCQPPQKFNPELVDTEDSHLDDRSSAIRRSTSGSSRPRELTHQSGFGGLGNFRHTRAHNLPATSEGRFRQSTTEFQGLLDEGRESRSGRSSSNRGRRSGHGGSQHGRERVDAPRMDMADVKPLEKSENRYIPKALCVGKDTIEDDMLERVFDRGIRALLNKLTLDNFDVVSDELLTWANKSVNETDGRILRHLVTLVYQKATDEPEWAGMYARLCQKLINTVDTQIEDCNLLTKDGKYLSGGYLVRKYLLTKCQEDFERGWKAEMPEDIESKEYYDAMIIKRRGLGLVRFVGELFLLDILRPTILHECVKRLLSNIETPEDEEVESLTKLLTTVGKKLDTPEAKSYMDVYFERIQAMSVNKNLVKRVRFLLVGIIEMRQAGWVARVASAGPKTIAEIHEEVERKKQAEEKMYGTSFHPGRRTNSHSGRGDDLGGRRAGRTAIGGSSGSGRSDQNQHVGDMSGFGGFSRSRIQQRTARDASTPGANPFGAFAGGSRGWSSSSLESLRSKRDDVSQSLPLGPGRRASSSSSRVSSAASTPKSVSTRNMFDLLTNDEEEDELLDSAHADISATTSKAAKPEMDTETMQRRIKSMVDEYVSVKNDADFIEYFKELGEVNYQKAVFELANNVMDRRLAHVEQVIKGVQVLCVSSVLTEDVAAVGLSKYSEMLEDIAIDAPNAYRYFGLLMAAAQVPQSCIADDVLKLIN